MVADMFWINERLGKAAEFTEAGLAFFSKESDDFTRIATKEEEKDFCNGRRASNADEAFDLEWAKLAASVQVQEE